MGHHKRCRVKRFGFFFSPLVLVFSRWPGPGDLGGSQVGRPVVENGFLTMAFRRHRLVHDGLSPILCQLKGTTCYNMLHYILHKHRGEVMLNPPRYLPWASMLYSKINRVSKHPMVYDHLPQTKDVRYDYFILFGDTPHLSSIFRKTQIFPKSWGYPQIIK